MNITDLNEIVLMFVKMFMGVWLITGSIYFVLLAVKKGADL